MGGRLIMPAYNKPSWMTWADQGGEHFGAKDVTKALQMGVSHADIQKAVKASDVTRAEQGITGAQNLSSNLQSAYDSAKSGTLDSSLGATDYTGTADIALYTQARGGMSGKVAQEIRDQANYNPNLQVGGSMSNLAMGIGSYASGQDAADSAAQDAADATTWRQNESDRRAAEAEARYNKMVEAQEAAAEAARKEALKVKYTGSTSVGSGQSAMGIKFAQSPAFASGAASRGTAQLARSDKGTKLTNMNIA